MDELKTSNGVDTESRVRQVIARTFGLSEQESEADLRMGSLPRWDSLGHMQLVIEIEKEFGVRFPSYAIAELQSIPSIVDAVNAQNSN